MRQLASGTRQLAGTKTKYRRAHAAPLAGLISGDVRYQIRVHSWFKHPVCRPDQAKRRSGNYQTPAGTALRLVRPTTLASWTCKCPDSRRSNCNIRGLTSPARLMSPVTVSSWMWPFAFPSRMCQRSSLQPNCCWLRPFCGRSPNQQ